MSESVSACGCACTAVSTASRGRVTRSDAPRSRRSSSEVVGTLRTMLHSLEYFKNRRAGRSRVGLVVEADPDALESLVPLGLGVVAVDLPVRVRELDVIGERGQQRAGIEVLGEDDVDLEPEQRDHGRD